MDEGARFPQVAAKAGHYESFYIKACEPGGGRGIWIRHTVHKRPGAEPNASIWFVFFDRQAQGPRATKVTVPASELSVPDGSWIRVADAELAPGQAEGSVDTDALGASWSLTFTAAAEPCKYLPADWLYAAPLPKTKFVAPVPLARFDGRLEIDDEESIELRGWPGMIGHNWGTEHAERWVWLEGTGFADSPDTYFDAGAARVKLGSRTSPWIPSGMLMLDGEPHRLGGLGAIRSAAIEEEPGVCSFVFPGRDIVVRGRVSAPEKDFVGWVYADPKGPEHNTVNCSVADLELTVERPGLPKRELTLAAGAAYELGMRETDHGIPIQPYPDG
ncbi:MAG TPA: hypothetical protein VEW07_10190 [Solirubrobacterales bacterium]|nr:hypothetical protein [Solirubrobacterales bacterium]